MNHDYSQNGEQAVILEVFDALGIKNGHLVDLGAGDGITMSNSRALIDRGWTGDLYDGDPRGAKDVEKVWITTGARLPACDFLNIDLDGNDFVILKEYLEDHHTPSLIVAEINPIFERHEAVIIPFNPDHVWNEDTYYGMSLGACEMLAKTFGYTLMHLHSGINAFLLRNDHAKAHPELVREVDYRVKFDHRHHPQGKKWTTLH